ncbi:MAG: tetratricopeptide repeat protein [Anaerolineae bacterium]|mgnify:CR=1 FL=1
MAEIALRQYESEIDHLIEEARYLEALAHTRHILRQHPRYIGAYYLLGKTLLEADQPELAIDMFQRALYADPEHLMARIGLMLAHQRLDNLDAAIWNLERAIELNPGDADLIDELRQLYVRRDGVEPERIPLNRAGLARLYLRGNRPGRAAEELRALLAENPQRLDLRLALAEAYWRDDQIVQAADTCQALLNDARYCLKANLLLGALWIDSGQEEGQTYLNRAQEIDIENKLAHEMFGAASPLKPREVSIEHLAYQPDALDVDRQAKWFQKLEAASVIVGPAIVQPEMTATEARLVDITAGLEAQIEIPDWLRELGSEEDGALSWMADIGVQPEVEAPTAEVPTPDWLREQEVEAVPGEGLEPAEGLPDWLRGVEPAEFAPEIAGEGLGLGEEGGVSSEGLPDWLGELEAAAQVEEGVPVPGAPETGIPDWLQALQPAAPPAEEIPLPAEGLPDWLSELKRPGEERETVEIAPTEEAPDWLASLQPAAPAVEEAAEEEEEELPDWMKDFSGMGETTEEALASEEGALPEWLTAFQPAETGAAVMPTEEAPEPGVPETGIPDWLSELGVAPAAVTPEAAPETGVPDTGLPDWLNELQPIAGLEAEAEAPEADLLDWLGEIPTEEAALTAEAPLPEALTFGEELEEELASTVEEAPVAEGFFGWEAFGEEITEVETGPLEAAHFVEEVEEVSAPGEMLSGDDALAWLESLAAGKEEELRAQAEAEAQARVAEILGHKPESRFIKPEPRIEEPTPVLEETPIAEDIFGWEEAGEEMAEAEAAPVELAEGELDWESLAEQLEGVEEEIPIAPIAEGDDALAWLESLALGKAEEFFAEPEIEVGVETEVQEAEPFGEVPLEEASAAEGFFGWEAFGAEITEVAPPAAEGDLMSGDEALAWLESLTMGKEEELRAQAEAEAQARVAEILGHKPAARPVEPEPVVEAPPLVEEETPTVEGFFGWEAFGEEIAEVEVVTPAVTEIVPEEVESLVESVAEGGVESIAETDLLSGDEALAWLSSLAAGKEEQLRAQAEAEAQARVAEILGRRAEPKVAAPPVVAKEPVIEQPVKPVPAAEVPIAEGDVMSGDDALAWLSSLAAGKEEQLRAQAEAEAQARVAEILGRKPGAKAEAPAAAAKVEAPVAAAKAEAPVAAAKVEAPVAAAPPVVEPPKPAPVSAVAPVGRAPAAVAEKVVEEEIVVAPEPVAVAPQVAPAATPRPILAEVEAGEMDEHAGVLAQARAAWQAGDVDTALARYNDLILAEARLDDVIADLQEAIAAQPRNAALYQVLGDAYMANGMVDQAIEIFNRAMSLI